MSRGVHVITWIDSASCSSTLGGIIEVKLRPQPAGQRGTRSQPWVLIVNGGEVSRHVSRAAGKLAGGRIGREMAKSTASQT
jgi:hypothetical protein